MTRRLFNDYFQCLVIMSQQFQLIVGSQEDKMLQIFNAMQVMMEGSGKVDTNFYYHVQKCLNSSGPRVYEAQNKMWQGLVDYAENGGGNGDNKWPSCSEKKVHLSH